jgi:hypothetical protein
MRLPKIPATLALLLMVPADTAVAAKKNDEFARVIEVLEPSKKWVVTYRARVWSCTAYKTCVGLKERSPMSPELEFKLLPELIWYVGKDKKLAHCWLQTCEDYRRCWVNGKETDCQP